MFKKLLAVAFLVLALGVVVAIPASAHDPMSTSAVFATQFPGSEGLNTFAFKLQDTDVHARTGAEDGTPVIRVLPDPMTDNELDSILSISEGKVYKGAYLTEENHIYDLVNGEVIRAIPFGTVSANPADVVFRLDGNFVRNDAFGGFTSTAFNFAGNTFYSGAYQRLDTTVFVSDHAITGNEALILAILASGAY